MDDRPGSPEFDVVSDGDRSGKFRHRNERFSTSSGRNATNLRAANENGANRLAANTNRKVNKAETVNLRVRNMGNITVKKEPESDEDREVSYSLSSLLQECDFVEAPRKKSRSLKSPTSLAMARSKSLEAARSVTGRPRQTLENVISSLKSARATDTDKPTATKRGTQFQNPVVPISMPSQIISVAPTSQNTLSFPSSGVLGGTGPQIVDVRSLATGAQTRLSVAPTNTAGSSTSKPVTPKPISSKPVAAQPLGLALNAGHPRRAASNIPVTTAPSTGSRVQASTAKPVVALAPKPLNIRFVLPATEPFNSSEFQQILQTALASVISQSKGIEANLLQQAIQAALTAVTQSSLPLNANQLKQAILSSLVALSSSASTTAQETPLISSKAVVRLPQATQPQAAQPQAAQPQAAQAAQLQAAQRQPRAIAPLLVQTPQSLSNISAITGTNKLPTTSPGNIIGLSTAGQISSPAPVIPTVTTAAQIVTTCKGNSPIANGGSQLVSGGLPSSPAQFLNPLNQARDALIKALQEKRVWNSPLSLSSSSSTSSSPSGTSTDTAPDIAMDIADTAMDSFDEPCSSFPPPSPVLPTSKALTVNSAGGGKSNIPTSAILNTTRIANTVPQTAMVTSNTSAPSVAIRPNVSPMSSAAQTALRTVSLQLLPAQGSSPASPLTSMNTVTNLIGRTNPVPQFPGASLPAQLIEYSITPQGSHKVPIIPRPVAKKYTSAQTQTATLTKGCGGGCCQYCRTCHENNNRCGLPSCQKTYPSKDALRKHYYFNPTHKLQIPQVRGSSTSACETFLPADLGDSHRKARLRELFRRLPDDEIKELVLPRMAKVISLFQLLEQKSLRVSVGSVSAFKMFTEFERFRKEVEGKLLEMISLQPPDKSQGKASTDSSALNSKDSGKPSDPKPSATNNSSQGGPTTAEVATNTVNSSQKSSAAQSNTGGSSTAGSSATTKKAVETICIDSDADASTAKTADKAAVASSQSGSVESLSTDKTTSKQDHQEKPSTAVETGTRSVEDKKASDSPSVEGTSEGLNKESDVVAQSAKPESTTKSSVESLPNKESENKEGEPMKQSSLSSQSLGLGVAVNESAASSDIKSSDNQPPQSEQQKEMTGHTAGESTSKDSTSVPMEIDELSMKNVVAADSKLPDVIMVDDQKETESCGKDGELKSSEDAQTKESHNTAVEKADIEMDAPMEKEATVCNVEEEKAVVSTGVERQDLAATSSDEKTSVDDKKQNEKPPDLSSKESEKAVDLAEIKDSEAAKKEVETTQEGKMAEKPAGGETKMAAMDVEEQGNNSKTDSEEGQALIVVDEKTDKVGTKEDKAKPSNDQDGNEKSKMDAEDQIKAGKQQEAVKDKVEGTHEEGGRVETTDVDSAAVSGNQQTPDVSMVTDKVEVDNTKVGDQVNKDASKEGNQMTEVSSGKDAETNAESTKQKESQEPCTVSDKGDESVNASSSVAASSSSNTAGSSTTVVSSVAAPSSSNTASSTSTVVASVAAPSNTASSSTTVVSSVAAPSSSNTAGSSTTVVSSVAASSSSDTTSSSTTVVSSRSAPASSHIIICRSSTTTGDSTSAGSSKSKSKAGGESTVVKKKKTLEETIEELSDEDEDEIDENNLLDFSLPYAVRWGRIIKRVQAVQAKKIARKENYSEQDMKHFIYHKPKDAANAVIIADCHAHPSFFRAYVMPALLDKHIDDFGLFGKKILSRLYLPKEKYVQILRNGIGPELAKILGINIFPTFKRIQDTWASIKRPLGTSPYLPKAVIAIEAEDDREVPDEVVAVAPAEKTAVPMNKNVQSATDKAKDSLKRPSPTDSVQNDSNKKQRLDTSDAQKDTSQTKESNKDQTESSEKIAQKDAASQLPSEANKEQTKISEKVAQKDASSQPPSEANKEQTKSSEKVAQKDASQPSEANKGQKPGETDSSKKDAQHDKNQPDDNNKSQTGKSDSTHASDKTSAPGSEEDKTGSKSSTSVPEKESVPQPDADNSDGPDTDGAEPMSVDLEQDPKSSDSATKEGSTESSVAVEKSTCSTSTAQTTPKASCSTDKPPSTTASTSAQTCASTIIPAKATIYTSGSGKKGASSVPFPASKGSPLFLIPVEKISPKLVEQFIAQGKGEGVKTRSSDKKKPKQSKQVSQVLVLIPSSNPNGSPTIQTLTSAEQLESTGEKKPLLLLPADKVPKSIASQSQTVRRKMVITMVAPSSEATSGTKSAASSARSASATVTSSSAGGQSDGSTSAVQSVKGPIMSAREGKARTASADGKSDSNKPPATGSDSSDAVDNSAKSLASVVNNTSALNLSTKDNSASTQSSSGAGPMDVDKADSSSSAGSNESDSQADKRPTSTAESDSLKESDSNKEGTANQSSVPAVPDAATSATPSGEADIDDNRSATSSADLDLLESSLLPSDFTLDNLLKDISADGSGSEANEMPPLDVSEIISSFEEMPVDSDSSTPANSSLCDTVGDAGAVGDPSDGANDSQMASSIQDRPSLQDEHNYASARRQSPRRTPATSKSASGSPSTDVSETADEAEASNATSRGLKKTSTPNTSGGSKGDSDVEEESPARKRRKVPTRTSARSSPQVTAASDKGAAAKSPLNTPIKGKGRKQ